MVTASHNPPEYNGYKVYWGNGAQIIPPARRGHRRRPSPRVEPCQREMPLADLAEARAHGLVRDDRGTSSSRRYLEGVLAPPAACRRGHGSDHRLHADARRGRPAGAGGAPARPASRNVHPVAEQREPDGAFPTVRFPNPEEPGAMDLSRRARRADAGGPRPRQRSRRRPARRADRARPRASCAQLTGNEVGVLLGHYLLDPGAAARAAARGDHHRLVAAAGRHRAASWASRYDEMLTGFKWIANRAHGARAPRTARFVFGYEEALGYTVGTLVRDKDGIGAALVCADLAGVVRVPGHDRHRVPGGDPARRSASTSRSSGTSPSRARAGRADIARIMEAFREGPPSRSRQPGGGMR